MVIHIGVAVTGPASTIPGTPGSQTLDGLSTGVDNVILPTSGSAHMTLLGSTIFLKMSSQTVTRIEEARDR